MKLVQIVYLAMLAAFSAASSPTGVTTAAPASESAECPGPSFCIPGSPPECPEECWPFDWSNKCWIYLGIVVFQGVRVRRSSNQGKAMIATPISNTGRKDHVSR
ncbi:uncharacterized protein HD556DRAFT_1538231 [Suillus plorans]|uniref:Uncharacterized protein n=1 Tax=Suillus plorans TaxID=116603 RepID=A0A9P7AJ27_9AGAM|nr:uncharacterized protein HD556DRAFT_1538231 [Suillus plorans]KAG1789563.1 hypothetical protein HD556DRAFT_1538231 [Suillus plorans]